MITLIVGIRHTYITHIFLFCLLLVEHLLNMQEVRVPLSVLKKKEKQRQEIKVIYLQPEMPGFLWNMEDIEKRTVLVFTD